MRNHVFNVLSQLAVAGRRKRCTLAGREVKVCWEKSQEIKAGVEYTLTQIS